MDKQDKITISILVILGIIYWSGLIYLCLKSEPKKQEVSQVQHKTLYTDYTAIILTTKATTTPSYNQIIIVD